MGATWNECAADAVDVAARMKVYAVLSDIIRVVSVVGLSEQIHRRRIIYGGHPRGWFLATMLRDIAARLD